MRGFGRAVSRGCSLTRVFAVQVSSFQGLQGSSGGTPVVARGRGARPQLELGGSKLLSPRPERR